MKRSDAARAGAEKLKRAEAAIDAALRETAELVGLLPSLRLDAQLSAVIGQEAIETLGDTLTHILSARRTIVKAHGDLAEVRAQIGCGALAIGDMGKSEDGDTPRTVGLRALDGGRAA
ncbi:hypothetical protein DDF62_16790 [Caulobacter radicis]|uniref:hypothetical protein n=1 Tax=Caulobacter radicis TaxID=2172650 RepID=UPI000D57D891|nr:hypothetical protein [Caulobacter radicis]PVM87288.1 hypothetical protein DDF62_16790 [Caulobacter radicis]